MVLKFKGETVCDIPLGPLADEAPLYDRPHVPTPKPAPLADAPESDDIARDLLTRQAMAPFAPHFSEATGALGRLMAADSDDVLISTKKARISSVLMICAFLAKLPVFMGLAIFTRNLGGQAMGCFLIGVALVYSALIWWALARR